MFAGDTIYDDNDADQIENLPPTALHRAVDLEIMKADKEGTHICLSINGYLANRLTLFYGITNRLRENLHRHALYYLRHCNWQIG